MYSHRVEILHGADGYHIALAVTYDLKLYFLPAAYAFFHKYLCDGGEPQPVCGNIRQLLPVLCYAAPCAPKGEGGAHYYGVAYLTGEVKGILYILHYGKVLSLCLHVEQLTNGELRLQLMEQCFNGCTVSPSQRLSRKWHFEPDDFTLCHIEYTEYQALREVALANTNHVLYAGRIVGHTLLLGNLHRID